MIHPAFEARDVTGAVLLKDRAIMDEWKAASDDERVRAVSIGGVNYAVVMDEALAARVRAAAPDLKVYRFDDERNELLAEA